MEKQQKNPHILERKIGNCMVRMPAVEHYLGGYEQYLPAILGEVGSADVVVPEYFPPEFAKNKDPLVQSAVKYYGSAQKLFYQLPDTNEMKGKEVIVVDPYYDGSGIYARAAGYGLSAVFGHGIGMKLSKVFGEDLPISRRTFLQGALRTGAYGAGFTFGMGIGFLATERQEANFRRRTVAQRLRALCDTVKKPSNVLLIYPPAHIEGIVKVLDDGENLRRRPPGDAHDGRVYKYEGTPPQWTRQL